MKNFEKLILISFAVISLQFIVHKSQAHCEIPCGIYEDSLRVQLIFEHITTIEKSMNMINTLSEEEDEDYNQIVRWTMNKEEHAKKIQDIVSQYFLHQRIKPTSPDDVERHTKYVKQMTYLHELLVFAMKAKQTTDLQYIEKLRESLQKFESVYFHTHEH